MSAGSDVVHYNNFLKGQGEFEQTHLANENMSYPEISTADYPLDF